MDWDCRGFVACIVGSREVVVGDEECYSLIDIRVVGHLQPSTGSSLAVGGFRERLNVFEFTTKVPILGRFVARTS